MGYYSLFTVDVEEQRRLTAEEVLAEFRSEGGEAAIAISDEGSPEERVKWYCWEEDFIALSKRFPNFLFSVTREGEESGDIEVGYFLNGTHQGGKAEFKLPEFVPPEGD